MVNIKRENKGGERERERVVNDLKLECCCLFIKAQRGMVNLLGEVEGESGELKIYKND